MARYLARVSYLTIAHEFVNFSIHEKKGNFERKEKRRKKKKRRRPIDHRVLREEKKRTARGERERLGIPVLEYQCAPVANLS